MSSFMQLNTRIIAAGDDADSISNGSGSSSDAKDSAEILRLMLIAENENAYKGQVDIGTLEQMLAMNDGNLLATFEMVTGARPSSRVNVQQITEEYNRKKPKNVVNLPLDNIVIGESDSMISKTDDPLPITDDSVEIIMEESGNSVPEPKSQVEEIPIHIQLKLRVLTLKLNEIDPKIAKEYTDKELVALMEKYGKDAANQISLEYLQRNALADGDVDSEESTTLVAIQQTNDKYSAFTKEVLKKKLKMSGFSEYENADDETICVLLDLGGGDVDCTIQNLRGTGAKYKNGVIPPPPYSSDPNLPWDKNPTKPLTEEAKETLIKEGRSIVTINQLPYDTLEHIFEYMRRTDVLVGSSVNQYFNKVSSSDYFWTTKQEKGKAGLIDNYDMDRYTHFTKNQTHYGNWKLWRLDNLFYTKIKQPPKVAATRAVTEETPIVELQDDGRIPFKHKYAQYRKQKLIRERVDKIEKGIENTKLSNSQNLGYEFNEHVSRSWIGFVVILALSAITGLILVPLSMDEFIPNEIGTYYWLFSWLSLGILTIPYFYIMIFHHSSRYEFYPVWSKRQLSGKSKLDHGGEIAIVFSSTWTWLPYIFLVAGLKYAVYPELPILSYIAIPGYLLAMMSFFCSAPTLGATLNGSDKERAAFGISSFFYGTMLLSLQIFLILLFAKIDGLEYMLNIPFSIIFIPGYVSLLCFPLGFFCTAFVAMVMGSDSCWSALLAGSGFGFLVLLIISPLLITAPFIAAVLDSFILQSIFPFVAIFSITYGLGIIILCIVAAVFCFIMCACRDYD